MNYEPMKMVFETIAKEENGTYSYVDKTFWGRGLSNAPVTYHKMIVNYKNIEIKIEYELGNHNLGSIVCDFPNSLNIHQFNISFGSHLKRIFKRKSNILNINCDDNQLKESIRNYLTSTQLEELARKHLFQPKIYIEKQEGFYSLISTFHLEFPDKHTVIQPMIRFYESMIDYMTKDVN